MGAKKHRRCFSVFIPLSLYVHHLPFAWPPSHYACFDPLPLSVAALTRRSRESTPAAHVLRPTIHPAAVMFIFAWLGICLDPCCRPSPCGINKHAGTTASFPVPPASTALGTRGVWASKYATIPSLKPAPFARHGLSSRATAFFVMPFWGPLSPLSRCDGVGRPYVENPAPLLVLGTP